MKRFLDGPPIERVPHGVRPPPEPAEPLEPRKPLGRTAPRTRAEAIMATLMRDHGIESFRITVGDSGDGPPEVKIDLAIILR